MCAARGAAAAAGMARALSAKLHCKNAGVQLHDTETRRDKVGKSPDSESSGMLCGRGSRGGDRVMSHVRLSGKSRLAVGTDRTEIAKSRVLHCNSAVLHDPFSHHRQ
jgi:hypothetical protein